MLHYGSSVKSLRPKNGQSNAAKFKLATWRRPTSPTANIVVYFQPTSSQSNDERRKRQITQVQPWESGSTYRHLPSEVPLRAPTPSYTSQSQVQYWRALTRWVTRHRWRRSSGGIINQITTMMKTLPPSTRCNLDSGGARGIEVGGRGGPKTGCGRRVEGRGGRVEGRGGRVKDAAVSAADAAVTRRVSLEHVLKTLGIRDAELLAKITEMTAQPRIAEAFPQSTQPLNGYLDTNPTMSAGLLARNIMSLYEKNGSGTPAR
ncbi:hypothetical protein B0H11DRAFT_1924777 [Mycena galericulata]|nr:hypothetical protein B0H11DRAFT_1924777 [Mycena galericulata]